MTKRPNHRRDFRVPTFRAKLKELREAKGLTLLEAAGAMKLSSAHSLVDAEDGYGLRLATAFKMARFYGLAIEEIWTDLSVEPVKGANGKGKTNVGRKKA